MKKNALMLLAFVVFAQAKEKDHSAEYKVGTFTGTGQVSDGSYANCSGGGCSAYSAAHNIHTVTTEDGVYAIEAPTSLAGTMLVGMMSGGNSPTMHKAWFMDNLHEGDKVLFAAKCDMKHSQHHCEFWLPNPDKPGKEFLTFGGFTPAVAKTNTTSLCGMGKLSASVEAQVCGKGDDATAGDPPPAPDSAPAVQPQAAVVKPIPVVAPAKPVVAKPAVQQQAPLCKSIMTDANGNQTCLDQQ